MWHKVLELICMVLFFPLVLKCQKPSTTLQYSETTVNRATLNLKKHHFANPYQHECSLAFSFYPELHNVDIRYIEKKLRTTMAARPGFLSVIKPKHKRVYYIFINNDNKNPNTVLLNELPANARIGVIAHEYAHIIDYQSKSGLQLIGYGIKYILSKRFKKKLENTVDKITIARGLGWQVYNFSSYVFNDSSVTMEYRNYKKKFYFTPPEILKEMLHKNEVYQNLSLLFHTSAYLTAF